MMQAFKRAKTCSRQVLIALALVGLLLPLFEVVILADDGSTLGSVASVEVVASEDVSPVGSGGDGSGFGDDLLPCGFVWSP